jgi:anaerobic selenocysteine-containing dehydrogenase
MEKKKEKWIRTHCARMDHGGCSLLVQVEQNRIVKIKGDPEGFLNRGYSCTKGRLSAEKLTHPKRLLHPLRRKGNRGEGKWERISWDDAIAEISRRLQGIKEKEGARAVAFCQGMPKGLEHFVLIRLANIFGSPNVVATQDVCHAPREVSGVHTCGFYPVADFHQKSELIMLWASNVTETNEEGEIGALALDQVKEGTELIVIDSRRTPLARKASCWLQPRPGSDHALALAMLQVIIEEKRYDQSFVEQWTSGFSELASHVQQYTPEQMAEVTWVPAPLIREAARRYADARPAAVQWGNPLEHTTNNFHTARALVSLMAVCGNLDVPGGNIQANEPTILGLGKFVRADLIPEKPKEMIHAHHRTIPRLMTVPPAYFRNAVREGVPYRVTGAYMQCTNPLLTYADSRKTYDALMKLDFLAVSDLFMTPTAALADVVLPAATQFECNDIGHYGLGHGYVLARPKVVEPPEECWPDMKILNELGKAMTPSELWHDDHETFLEEVLQPAGMSYEQFVAQGYLHGEERYEKYRKKGFRTPTGKVELVLSTAEKYGLSPLPVADFLHEKEDEEFPLILTSAKSPLYLHSSYRWMDGLRKREGRPVVQLHPDTAARYDIQEGERVKITTQNGTIVQEARISKDIHPRMIYAAYGWWFPEEPEETLYGWRTSNYNMLTTMSALGREFGTPDLKGIPCSVRPERSRE